MPEAMHPRPRAPSGPEQVLAAHALLRHRLVENAKWWAMRHHDVDGGEGGDRVQNRSGGGGGIERSGDVVPLVRLWEEGDHAYRREEDGPWGVEPVLGPRISEAPVAVLGRVWRGVDLGKVGLALLDGGEEGGAAERGNKGRIVKPRERDD